MGFDQNITLGTPAAIPSDPASIGAGILGKARAINRSAVAPSSSPCHSGYSLMATRASAAPCRIRRLRYPEALEKPLRRHEARGTEDATAEAGRRVKGAVMAIISDPFVMEVPRKLTDQELINAIRQDIIGELEAIHEYDAHVQATDNEDAKKGLSDIRDEEREHMGELLELLERLAPDEKGLHDEGREEVREMLDK